VDLDEQAEHRTLLDDERELIAWKRGPTRPGFAVLLKWKPSRAHSLSDDEIAGAMSSARHHEDPRQQGDDQAGSRPGAAHGLRPARPAWSPRAPLGDPIRLCS
jgi:hypothetical protein